MKRIFLLICFIGTVAVSAQEVKSNAPDSGIKFRLHPNPVYDGVVFVKSNYSTPRTIRIYDLFGKIVLERRTESERLFLGSLVPGVYMLQLQQKGELATKKLVIR
ncbi:MAG: T9SS type A sorting domain-containing protein [Robiginitalea sp.]|jgi:hypothetical protein